MTTDVRSMLERDLSRVGPARFDLNDLELLRHHRRRREALVSLVVAVALVAGGIVGVLRAVPPEPRVPVNQPAKGGWPSVDLRQVVLGESATPLQARFQARDRGEEALQAGLPADGLPADDANARMTTGFVQAERTVFERVGEPPLHDAALETWAAEYDSPDTARAALGVFLEGTVLVNYMDWGGLIEPRPVALDGADEGSLFIDRAIPRDVVYLWRHENLLLRVTTQGNFPPSDVRRIAEAMDARATAASR
ncbi:MAG: hypothetical protein ACXWW9_02630 [Actinomycetota bacterium]